MTDSPFLLGGRPTFRAEGPGVDYAADQDQQVGAAPLLLPLISGIGSLVGLLPLLWERRQERRTPPPPPPPTTTTGADMSPEYAADPYTVALAEMARMQGDGLELSLQPRINNLPVPVALARARHNLLHPFEPIGGGPGPGRFAPPPPPGRGRRAGRVSVAQALAAIRHAVRGNPMKKRQIQQRIAAFAGTDELAAELYGLDVAGMIDYGEDLGGYGADELGAAPPSGFLESVANMRYWEQNRDRLVLDGFGVQGPMGQHLPGGAIVQGVPAPTGKLEIYQLYASNTGTNPVAVLSTGAVVDTPTGIVQLTTRTKPYKSMRIVGVIANVGSRSAGCTVLIRNLTVGGAGVNLLSEDSAAWCDADTYASDNPARPGLRTGEGSVISANNTATMEVAITGDAGDSAKASFILLCQTITDVVDGRDLSAIR